MVQQEKEGVVLPRSRVGSANWKNRTRRRKASGAGKVGDFIIATMFLLKSQYDTIAQEPVASMDRPAQVQAATMLGYFVALRVAAWFLQSGGSD